MTIMTLQVNVSFCYYWFSWWSQCMAQKLIRTFVNHYFVIGKKENFHKIIPVFHLEKKKSCLKIRKKKRIRKKKIVIKLLFIPKLINLIFVLQHP